MCFLNFWNQTPSAHQTIFQFTEGGVGKLESKNMENTDKNTYLCEKT